MLTLAIETSHRGGGVALVDGRGDRFELLGEAPLETGGGPDPRRAAQTLVPSIALLLKQHGLAPQDLQLVAVASGPGSFTGLRIGVVAAKTMAHAAGAKLVGVHTLAAIAEGCARESGRLWAIADAQRGELFCAAFDASDTAPPRQPPTHTVPIADWLARLEPGDAVAGQPLNELAERLPEGVAAVDQERWTLTAASVGRLGLRLAQAGLFDDPLQLVPSYYRRSAAEEKANA